MDLCGARRFAFALALVRWRSTLCRGARRWFAFALALVRWRSTLCRGARWFAFALALVRWRSTLCWGARCFAFALAFVCWRSTLCRGARRCVRGSLVCLCPCLCLWGSGSCILRLALAFWSRRLGLCWKRGSTVALPFWCLWRLTLDRGSECLP